MQTGSAGARVGGDIIPPATQTVRSSACPPVSSVEVYSSQDCLGARRPEKLVISELRPVPLEQHVSSSCDHWMNTTDRGAGSLSAAAATATDTIAQRRTHPSGSTSWLPQGRTPATKKKVTPEKTAQAASAGKPRRQKAHKNPAPKPRRHTPRRWAK